MPSEPFAHTAGPRDARIVMVGEAWGEVEDRTGSPFAGSSGKELFTMLGEVWTEYPEDHEFVCKTYNSESLWLRVREDWFAKASIMLTNVFNLRPIENKIDNLCISKADAGLDYPYPAIRAGKYVDPKYFPELARLKTEIELVNPNLIVALGNIPCWAIFNILPKITKLRGAVAPSILVPRIKALPTYHPASLFRQWQNRPIVLADLFKAKFESKFSEIRRPSRSIIINPTLQEIERYYLTRLSDSHLISVDVETVIGQISCVGFAPSPVEAMVIPIFDETSNFWDTPDEEFEVWRLIERILKLPIPKLAQNGIYDIQYFLKMGIVPARWEEDTMILHHSIYPEMTKDLGFLGSIYCNDTAWKNYRQRVQEFKKDD
jgi:uracil-DNA glycosylase